MTVNYQKAYRTIMDDFFPKTITMDFDGQTLIFEKQSWKIEDEDSGEVVEKGLRYGENPGQRAALYRLVNGNLILGDCAFIQPGKGLVSAISEEDMVQFGKHPGKINFTDIDNSLNILRYVMDRPCTVITKHNNPCGAAYGTDLAESYSRANGADRIAAFGGCAVFNRILDKTTAELVAQNYLEVVAAPDFEGEALDLLKKRTNLRIVRIKHIERLAQYRTVRVLDFKSLMDGGFIIQESALNRILSKEDFQPAIAVREGKEYRIERPPTESELDDMLFGWSVEQGVSSNSVLYVKDGCTAGIGTGEQDRVGVAEIAVFKAYTKYADQLCFDRYQIPYKTLELEVSTGKRPKKELEEIDEITRESCAGLRGAVMISDAFFPFRDGVDVGLAQGVRAIVQPGGSLRDWEVIEACNQANPPATMVFTGQRAFKH
jgi:phosphoribosylaminoimidazolecarboxamide formyltransferase / IMP cyclohydrolase